ncbi:general substrate transporter [Wallemia mellicola]|uniref:General substrate transporter n=1 Tax=Wallemia mellicola TaxID=1708541 RepID=A0A4T0R571_9BASI|nr:hypothetical protein E3Q23_02981 [Wallemia mellicola]TIB75250.1 hypothetical protein E3Q24_00003 [Wallemia mellicola]TIB82431.1 general substrate transporter [Wallemia mellicola]TIB87364.1 general substrate transporter [Wallemia mellicola]TIB98309.1 general substrate transporter [Wallemia mellicola]
MGFLDILNIILGGYDGYARKLKGKKLEYSVVICAGVAFLLFGYDQGVMSGIITEPYFIKTFPHFGSDPDLNPKQAVSSMVVAIYEIGCLLGSIMVIFFGDVLGRRRCVVIGTIIMIIGAIVQTCSYQLRDLIAGRIVTGIGNGMNTSTIPVLQSEMAHKSRRGFLVLFEGALIAGGIAISYLVNLGMWYMNMTDEEVPHASAQWRFPFALQLVFAIAMLLGVAVLPESPRWLAKHNMDDESMHILCRLRNGTRDDAHVIQEFKVVYAQEAGGKFSFWELFRNDENMTFWRTSVAFLSQAFQQIGGINLVTYYSTTLFLSIGLDDTKARIVTAGNGVEYFLSGVAALFVIDRMGRIPLMITGSCIMIASLVMLVGFQSSGRSDLAVGSAVMLFVFNTGFALGWLGVTWLYPAEISTLRSRHAVNGLSTCANWLFNYLIVQIAPICLDTIKYRTYIIFIATNTFFIPVIWLFFPETKGHSLEEMDRIFVMAHKQHRNPVFVEREYTKQIGSYGQGLGDQEKTKVAHVERFDDLNGHDSDSDKQHFTR